MIFIVVQMQIRPDRREDWLTGIRRYTEAVRQEPGGPEFECFESVDTPNRFTMVESFESREASDGHVQTEHFTEFITWVPGVLVGAPRIVNVELPGEGWSEMSELASQA